MFAENPIGRGYCGGDRKEAVGLGLPRLTYPEERLSSPTGAIRAAAFGPIQRDWTARSRYAGTYDDSWRLARAPFLPADFDERFHQSAPKDQHWDGILPGGVPVQVTGLGGDEIGLGTVFGEGLSGTLDRLNARASPFAEHEWFLGADYEPQLVVFADPAANCQRDTGTRRSAPTV